MTSRITKTTTGKYDQIFALSQAYLNTSFEHLFDNVPELQTLNAKNIMGSIENGAFRSPSVSFNVKSGANIAIFYMNLKSGHLKNQRCRHRVWHLY